jgi:hypothetical protein
VCGCHHLHDRSEWWNAIDPGEIVSGHEAIIDERGAPAYAVKGIIIVFL